MNLPEPIRLVNLGAQPAVRTQSVYHAIAKASEEGPDTIVLTHPAKPYVCIGYHQNIDAIDERACKRLGLPIVRRLIGGGATYLDSNQLFYQFIFNKDHVPAIPNRMYEHILQIPLNTLTSLGFDATLRDDTELEIEGKRIAGIGGGLLGNRAVVVGNFLFEFDFAAMSQLWSSPWSAYQELATSTARDRITTLRSHQPTLKMEIVIDAFRKSVATFLDRPVIEGYLTAEESRIARRLDEELVADKHLSLFSAKEDEVLPPLKISGGVFIHAEFYRREQDNYRAALCVRDGQIEAAIIERWKYSDWHRLKIDLAGMAYTDWKSEQASHYA